KAIIDDRKINGSYKDIFDLTKRVTSKAANKKCLESLAQSGAFDCFEGIHRAQYFASDSRDPLQGIERAARFGNAMSAQQSSMQNTLFGDDHHDNVATPTLANCEPWNSLEKLKREKEVIGFYISGHPLDEYRFEIANFCSHKIDQLNDLEKLKNKDITIAGILSEVNHRMSKMGKPFGTFTVEDYTGSVQMALFGEDYGKMREFLVQESFVYIKARVQSKYNSPDQFEAKPVSIQYLSDISDKLARSITLKVPIHAVSDSFLNDLNQTLNNSPGNCVVKFNILDPEQQINLELPSKRVKIKVNRDLISSLDKFKYLEYKLN
ncbi:MAG TPA: OB-fold nucleic acid binding domain-containing protein, partial [Bacteroidia bacterium]|nr:OB-fold nucleic acid binding domain-containing protein [Bacteroidia bacterium]